MMRTAMKRAWPCLTLMLALSARGVWADEPSPASSLPLTTATSLGGYDASLEKPLTIAQQRARFEADQRMLRMQWNKWIGYEPLRPSMPNPMTNNEMNPYHFQPIRQRPVWTVTSHGSRIW